MEPFGTRLVAALADRGPLCVGIDPHPELLAAWGLDGTPAGLERFALGAVEALGETAAVLKPQSAFFEVHGSAGIAVLERTIAAARERGALVLLDVKRGDIGSTMAAYAAAYLTDGSPLAVDAITLSPYLGFGALAPALNAASTFGRGVFVLCLTSNPEGAAVQRAAGPGGVTVAQQIADSAATANAGRTPLGSVGLVVGATIGDLGVDLSSLNGPILAPGLGAQGATPGDLSAVFGGATSGLLPTTSRGVLRAGPEPGQLRAAARAQIEAVRAVLG